MKGSETPLKDGQIRIAGIVKESIVDGPGLRLVVFSQGCPHLCKGCHNPHTHSYKGGMLAEIGTIVETIRANPLLDGITLSGGEPFEQAAAFAVLAKRVKKLGLHVMTYTGYTYEAIQAGIGQKRGWRELLEYTDVLVDGPFLWERRSLRLQYRGSDNQRIIDVADSWQRQHAVCLSMEA